MNDNDKMIIAMFLWDGSKNKEDTKDGRASAAAAHNQGELVIWLQLQLWFLVQLPQYIILQEQMD
jgi:hypothetical protein